MTTPARSALSRPTRPSGARRMPLLPPAVPALAFVLAALSTGACSDGDARTSLAVRDTLVDGRIQVHYASDPATREDSLVADLRIGTVDGDGPEVFGDVRGVEVGPDGAIYVLDYQTSEIRVFEPDGNWRATLTRKGEGPGELGQANGLVFAPDGNLWVNDHGAGAMKVLTREGEELARHPLMVSGYGYVWEGVADDMGAVWQEWSHSIASSAPDPSATGPVEYTSRRYYKSFDPGAQSYDSVFLGISSGRSFRAALENGQVGFSLPFSPSAEAVIDGSGRIWSAETGRYHISRIEASGDTTLVIEVDIPPPAVTADDRRRYLEGSSVFERAPAIRTQVAALIPDVKPVLTRLHTDDEGRLWVGRTVPRGERPLYDVFRPDGEHLGSVRGLEGIHGYVLPRIVQGAFHALITGEFGVQYVVRAPLPELGGGEPEARR